MRTLTSRQKKVLDYIKKHQERQGYTPTYEVIAKHFGYTAKSTVQHYVKTLEAKGYLSKEKHHSQSLQVNDETHLLPLLGRVAAGAPLDYKTPGEKIEVPRDMVTDSARHFVLRVKGDSMIEEGILDGDYVVVREQNVAENGDIVVAEVDHEATIKRYVRKKNQIELHSANTAYKPILISGDRPFQISGVYCGLIRYS